MKAKAEVPKGEIKEAKEELWAMVEIMGHVKTAGKVTISEKWGGLLQVDVPIENGDFATELIGFDAIFRVRFISEEIARTLVLNNPRIIHPYSSEVITRKYHDDAISKLNDEVDGWRSFSTDLRMQLVKNGIKPDVTEMPEEGIPF